MTIWPQFPNGFSQCDGTFGLTVNMPLFSINVMILLFGQWNYVRHSKILFPSHLYCLFSIKKCIFINLVFLVFIPLQLSKSLTSIDGGKSGPASRSRWHWNVGHIVTNTTVLRAFRDYWAVLSADPAREHMAEHGGPYQGLKTGLSHMSRWGSPPPTFWRGVRTTPPPPSRSSKPGP